MKRIHANRNCKTKVHNFEPAIRRSLSQQLPPNNSCNPTLRSSLKTTCWFHCHNTGKGKAKAPTFQSHSILKVLRDMISADAQVELHPYLQQKELLEHLCRFASTKGPKQLPISFWVVACSKCGILPQNPILSIKAPSKYGITYPLLSIKALICPYSIYGIIYPKLLF